MSNETFVHRDDVPFAALVGEQDQVRAPSFDGTPIFAEAHGTPYAPVVLAANGLGARMDAFEPVCEPFYDRFRFVTWDYRGLYKSARPLKGYGALSIEDHARDALAILDALPVGKVHLMGWSLGVQVSLEVYRRRPERIASLIFVCGVPGRLFSSAFTTSLLPAPLMAALTPRAVAHMQRFDGLSKRFGRAMQDASWFVPSLIRSGLLHHDIDVPRFQNAARQILSNDLHVYLELLRQGGRHDAADVLPRIDCPTLVVAGTKDVLTPFSRQSEMVDRIPGATLCPVYGGTHFAPLEIKAPIIRALNTHFSAEARAADSVKPSPLAHRASKKEASL